MKNWRKESRQRREEEKRREETGKIKTEKVEKLGGKVELKKYY